MDADSITSAEPAEHPAAQVSRSEARGRRDLVPGAPAYPAPPPRASGHRSDPESPALTAPPSRPAVRAGTLGAAQGTATL
jgi:hypothetical protein